MSVATGDALDAAVRAHIASETGGDMVVGWVVAAAIVEHEHDTKTSFLSMRGLARYEMRGVLHDAGSLLDGMEA